MYSGAAAKGVAAAAVLGWLRTGTDHHRFAASGGRGDVLGFGVSFRVQAHPVAPRRARILAQESIEPPLHGTFIIYDLRPTFELMPAQPYDREDTASEVLHQLLQLLPVKQTMSLPSST
jgi:hypothetical protein